MKQYNMIKTKYPDSLLLFRVGDFYETFGEDAVKTSKILGIILTKKGAGSLSEIELAGFPYHSIDNYLPKLIKAGCRVAICEQLEDPKMTKTIVKRGVTELVTPGLAMIDNVLDQKKNNYLASLYNYKKDWAVSFLDISTGDFFLSQGNFEEIFELIEKYNPSEILISKPFKNQFKDIFGPKYSPYLIEDWVFEFDFCKEKLINHFKTNSLKGFGIEKLSLGIISSGVILYYLSESHQERLNHISSIKRINNLDFVGIDDFTSKNLELFSSNTSSGTSLLESIDYTITPMGARLLRNWLCFPIKFKKEIKFRNDIVGALLKNDSLNEKIIESLSKIGDIERLMSKLATLKINPRELMHLNNSLQYISPIKKDYYSSKNKNLIELSNDLNSCEKIILKISERIMSDPSANILKGSYIKEGFSNELDELKTILNSGKQFIEEMQNEQIEKTGINSLKIAFNNVFGYYIEVRNTHKNKVPIDWIRKQTLVNAERYITQELKEYEIKILSATDKIKDLEFKLFNELLENLQEDLNLIKNNAYHIAKIDCLTSFSILAKKKNYCCPTFNSENKIDINGGRHPVIENLLPPGEHYISNDLFLDKKNQQIVMVTGPNMSGKSALLRQTALIVILSQIGCYVPAKSANLCITDKIFTRVGASDNISMGESTFMVEMNESSSILNNITENSLVLLDEIGRGTSTYDGISIAWAIAEFLHEHKGRPKTIFATHYHELNQMTKKFKRIKNYNVSVKEMKNDVIFLRKLVPGGSAHSFGIHVAKMAGMPNSVLLSAENKLKFLQNSHNGLDSIKNVDNSDQIKLNFISKEEIIENSIIEEINKIDINTLSPIEALTKLNEIKQKIILKK